jgi:hypothetical protein
MPKQPFDRPPLPGRLRDAAQAMRDYSAGSSIPARQHFELFAVQCEAAARVVEETDERDELWVQVLKRAPTPVGTSIATEPTL